MSVRSSATRGISAALFHPALVGRHAATVVGWGVRGRRGGVGLDGRAVALKNSRRREVSLEESRPLPLTTVDERLRALTAAQKYFKALPYRDHQPQLDRVLASLEPVAP